VKSLVVAMAMLLALPPLAAAEPGPDMWQRHQDRYWHIQDEQNQRDRAERRRKAARERSEVQPPPTAPAEPSAEPDVVPCEEHGQPIADCRP
jgi:hypothetical protein